MPMNVITYMNVIIDGGGGIAVGGKLGETEFQTPFEQNITA
jgi:hypothetical protein